LTMQELTEWKAYTEIEPWGDALLDAHHAELAAALVNSFDRLCTITLACHGVDADQQIINPKEFSFWQRSEAKQDKVSTVKESIAFVARLNELLGGVDLRKKH